MTKSRRPEGSSWNTSRDVSLFFIVYAAALTESVEMTSDVSATYEFSPDSCWGNKTHHFWHEVSDYRSFWSDFREFLLLDISCSFHVLFDFEFGFILYIFIPLRLQNQAPVFFFLLGPPEENRMPEFTSFHLSIVCEFTWRDPKKDTSEPKDTNSSAQCERV